MMTTVYGTYENGQITLDESLPVKTGKAKVLVTLIEEVTDSLKKPKRQLGMLEGTFTGDYWNSEEFNESLDDFKDYM